MKRSFVPMLVLALAATAGLARAAATDQKTAPAAPAAAAETCPPDCKPGDPRCKHGDHKTAASGMACDAKKGGDAKTSGACCKRGAKTTKPQAQ